MRALVITLVRTRIPAIMVKSRLVTTSGMTLWTYAMSSVGRVEPLLFAAPGVERAWRSEKEVRRRRREEERASEAVS
jgi:hypothetical protein